MDFVQETKELIGQMRAILEEVQTSMSLASRLEGYGQIVDRITAGARLIAVNVTEMEHPIHKIADYAGLCKAVGYKTAQLKDNPEFYQICIALMMDATDILEELNKHVEKGTIPLHMRDLMSQTLIDRLRWVSGRFSAEIRDEPLPLRPKGHRMTQQEIDQLLEKLGL